MTKQGLVIKGVNYDVGTNYMPGYLSREVWHQTLMQEEIRVIKNDLHCNSINIFGSSIDRLSETATTALERGLHVWLQPRLINSNPDEMVDHLSKLARAAEHLRKQYTNVTLNIGCELSIFMSDLIPGRTFMQRAAWLGYMWWLWMLLPRFNNKLNSHLKKAISVVRSNFNGQITYGSGVWENVDWGEFDIVGLNYYRESSNQFSYIENLRGFHRYKKPIVITEFGCCSFEGAARLGGSGDRIVDYTKSKPELKRVYQRNEQVQADYIVDLLNIYKTENIYGAFVFEFTEPSHPYSLDPQQDLDIASYGIIKVYPDDSERPDVMLQWEPKLAFHEIARFYSSE